MLQLADQCQSSFVKISLCEMYKFIYFNRLQKVFDTGWDWLAIMDEALSSVGRAKARHLLSA